MFGTWSRGSFGDREDAGRRLAEKLLGYRDENPVVLALPRGGVPVAYEIARALHAPLDVFFARKLGAPGRPEFGIGAVAQGGLRVLNERAVEAQGIPEEYIERAAQEETAEIERRLGLLRGKGHLEPEVGGRTAILVDDGLATGVTALAAVRALRRRNPGRLVLAVPVCAARSAETLRGEVDELVCLKEPSDLGSVGFWYKKFYQVEDEEVIELLERAGREQEERGSTGSQGRT
ncbi:MAG: phosphoribosyltransferase [Actinomycetota bacterium]|nr:phosphoribosyltransferase [Actinomycetota bacterium]